MNYQLFRDLRIYQDFHPTIGMLELLLSNKILLTCKRSLTLVPKLAATAPMKPIANALGVETNPLPGVMQTKPAMAPEQKPTAEIFFSKRQSQEHPGDTTD